MRLAIIPAVDTWPRLVERCRTRAGRLGVVAVAAALLWPLLHVAWMAPSVPWLFVWPELVALLVATSLWPARRRMIVAIAGGLLLLTRVPPGWGSVEGMARMLGIGLPDRFRYISIVEAMLVAGGYLALVIRFADARLFRRPLALFVAVFIALACVAAYAPMRPELSLWLWGALFALGPLIWFVGYALHDRRMATRPSLLVRLGQLTPFWGSTNTPFPKSGSYLDKIEAKDDAELAVWQLKGCKLLAWSIVLAVAHFGYRRACDRLQIPSIRHAVANAGALDLSMRWAAVAANFVEQTFQIALVGHPIIALCRLAGFKALRNTYRPFESLSIAEYFNRYYFYFKELLVDFFFYPTFLRHFKTRPRLRLFAATFAAAGFGNVLYHYLRDMPYVALLGPVQAAIGFQTYAAYGVALGVGVAASQLGGRRKPTTWLGRRAANVWVYLFFAILLVFTDPKRTVGIGYYGSFVTSLFRA